jgi:phosphopantetheinyl transferase (holo-ACP synthase)
MLGVRSFRDYPEVFLDGDKSAFFAPVEIEHWSGLRSPGAQRNWLLRAMATKELMERYCTTHWGLQPGPQDLRILQRSDGSPYVSFSERARPWVSGPVSLAISQCERYVAVSARPSTPGHTFAVDVEPIEPRYPFFPDDLYTEGELAAIRTHDQAGADAMLAAYWAVKKSVGRTLGIPTAEVARSVEILSLKPGGEAELSIARDALGAPDADGPPVVRARTWFFEHNALAFSAMWRHPGTAPRPHQRIEEEPVLPAARYCETTL